MVRPDLDQSSQMRLVTADLVDAEYPWRHDPTRLSRAVLDIFDAERPV